MENRDGPHTFTPARVIVYRCPACKIFVAASRDPKLIEVAQRSHVCLESLAFSTPSDNPSNR